MVRNLRERQAAEVARTVAAEPGRLRRCSAPAALALLSAAALVPVIASGTPLAALAGLAGNLGSGVLSAAADRALTRLRKGERDGTESGTLRDELAAELLARLEKGDSAALELQATLTDLLMRADGVEAAVAAAGDEVRGHLARCFSELAAQQGEALGRLDRLTTGQRRQERWQREQAPLIEEMADRQRLLTRMIAELLPAKQPGLPATSDMPTAVAPVMTPADGPVVIGADGWNGGAEVAIGDCVYLLHSDYAEEHFSVGRSVLLRQARALRLVPAGTGGGQHAWLRQVELRRTSPAARAALGALSTERDLLAKLGGVRGLPRIAQMVAGSHTATLVLGWPSSRSGGGPCETLQAGLGPGVAPIDSWRTFRLFTGLAGLCDTLASLHDAGIAHRALAPSGIVVLDDGRLVLRDLGLAGHGPQPGEGPAGYQAPEQFHGGRGRPGSSADVYQVAAIAYHLLAGHPPHPRAPLPVRTRAPEVPEQVSVALNAALSPDPGGRPDPRSLGGVFRSARDHLS